MVNLTDLSGRHIVVTGASSGLGKEVCLLSSRLGAKLSIIARREEKLYETIKEMDGDNHFLLPFDVTDIESIEGIIRDIVDKHGKVDGFVHAAGFSSIKPLNMTKYAYMLDSMKVHLFSFVEFVRVIGKKKNSNDGASIVAISSAGTARPGKGKVAYSASKGALDSVIRPIALELGESRGIRINTVNPGWIKTDIYQKYLEQIGQEEMDAMIATHILGVAEPGEIAKTVAFLLSDASNKITGQNIFVDSGFSIN